MDIAITSRHLFTSETVKFFVCARYVCRLIMYFNNHGLRKLNIFIQLLSLRLLTDLYFFLLKKKHRRIVHKIVQIENIDL